MEDTSGHFYDYFALCKIGVYDLFGVGFLCPFLLNASFRAFPAVFPCAPKPRYCVPFTYWEVVQRHRLRFALDLLNNLD